MKKKLTRGQKTRKIIKAFEILSRCRQAGYKPAKWVSNLLESKAHVQPTDDY